MIIVILHNRFGKNIVGGAEIHVCKIAQALKEEGHKVYIVSTECFHGYLSLGVHQDDTDEDDVYRFFPLNICAFESLNKLPFLLHFSWHKIDCLNIHSLWALRSFFEQIQPDIVWSHNLMGLCRPLRFVLKGAKFVKWIHTIHDVQLLNLSGLVIYGKEDNWTNQGFFANFHRVYSHWLIGSPSLVVSPSKWLLDEHKKYNFFKNSKILVLPNPIEPIESIMHLSQSQECHILYLSQLEEHKGILVFLGAIEKFRVPNNQKLIIDIVGSGSLSKKVVEQCVKFPHIKIHGRREGKELEAIWSQADVVVVPSLCYENAPMVITEALVRGIPVVASRIGGIPEMIKVGINGWLYTPGDIEEFSTMLKRALEMPKNSIRSQRYQTPKEYIETVLRAAS